MRAVQRSDYEDPDDRRLRSALEMVWPVHFAVRLFLRELGEPWLHAKLLAQGVRLGPRQLEHYDRMVRDAAQFLGVEPPELYLVQSAALEPVLLGVGHRNTLALTSAMVEASKEEHLQFMLGRAMGQIKSGHVLYLTLIRWIRDVIGSRLKNLLWPALTPLYAWHRAATFSADRAGLIVSQDMTTACRALLQTSFGAAAVFSKIDIERYARTGLHELMQHPLHTVPELFGSAPYMARRLAELYAFRASAAYAELFPDSADAVRAG